MNRAILLLAALLLFPLSGHGQQFARNPFDLDRVRLLESPFLHAQNKNIEYILEMEPDRLLAPFLREAGLPAKVESYTNWENTGLDGHIGGHYLSALSKAYAASGDERLYHRLDYMLSELSRVQEANGNGYIGGVPDSRQTWNRVAAGDLDAHNFSLAGKWVPLYNIHKTYAGLRDAYIYAGREDALEMLDKMTQWAAHIFSGFDHAMMQDMLRSEHGGLNEVFADAAYLTGNQNYLELARRFSDESILNPLLAGDDRLDGLHANTQIPKVIGYKRIAELDGNSDWSDAASFFWENVVGSRTVCFGGNSTYEHFHPCDDYSRMLYGEQGPETCNTYNMLLLSQMLYRTQPDNKYVDYYERALYNHILSSQHPETGGLVYFTQIRPGHYRVYSQPHTSFWCCVGSGIENHSQYGKHIYSHNGDTLYVDLFVPSELDWKEKGIKVIQENVFPEQPRTKLTVVSGREQRVTLSVRKPEWLESPPMVRVNGIESTVRSHNGRTEITLDLTGKDTIEVELPMGVRAEQLPDGTGFYSFMYGPVVLAARFGTDDLAGLHADDSRGGHIAHGHMIPLTEIPFLTGTVDDPSRFVTHQGGLYFLLHNVRPSVYEEGTPLEPFYGIHDSRYIIYFPQVDDQDVETYIEQTREREKERIELDRVTVDKVICGEQQPESDHFIRTADSWTGMDKDRHYRMARGSFGYTFSNREGSARRVMVSFLEPVDGEAADVLADGTVIGTFSDVSSPAMFDLPENMRAVEKPEITIRSIGNTTVRVTKIRLIR